MRIKKKKKDEEEEEKEKDTAPKFMKLLKTEY